VIISFRHKGLERLFLKGNKAGIAASHEKRLRIVLFRLNAAKESKDMRLPGLSLHSLSGNMKGFWSVSVSENWRVVFRFEGNDVFDVDYLDYH
jgi:proteic killer suppression protein